LNNYEAYVPVLFATVLNPELWNGSFHFFQYLILAKECLSAEHFEFIFKYFQINSYFAHPENLLLCALLSPMSSELDKERALELIIEFRSKTSQETVRKFVKPSPHEINCESDNIIDLINWDIIAEEKKTPPPILRSFTNDQLKNGDIDLPKLLCHSQNCERAVKQTSKSVLKWGDEDNKAKQDIIVTENSRNKYPIGCKKEAFRRDLNF